jgi:hypothetical protein
MKKVVVTTLGALALIGATATRAGALPKQTETGARRGCFDGLYRRDGETWTQRIGGTTYTFKCDNGTVVLILYPSK